MYVMCIVYRGQAEKEFKVEVEAIGRVRHKNLVRLLGYCAEGASRYIFSSCSIVTLQLIQNNCATWLFQLLSCLGLVLILALNYSCFVIEYWFMSMWTMETWNNGFMVM